MFKRPFNPIVKALMKREYGEIINKETISKMSMRKIIKIMHDDNMRDIGLYLHHVLDEWYKENQNNEDVFRDIKRIIRVCKIELNIIEEHNLALVDERSFSRQRTVKELEVGIKLLQSETVGIKFLNAELSIHDGEKYLLSEGVLLASNRRIIFLKKEDEPVSFYWKKINERDFNISGFNFKYSKNKYMIRIHDQPTLNATIKNLLDKRVK
ncbi:MAG: hypothetical protein KAG14_00340 [Mycoplasmataceae bacterium]|nr:hypothetical protein [Mycoplasmataceae bacterium]